jgi:hypothetical protein
VTRSSTHQRPEEKSCGGVHGLCGLDGLARVRSKSHGEPINMVLPFLIRRLSAYPPAKVTTVAKALTEELGHPPNTEQVAAKL